MTTDAAKSTANNSASAGTENVAPVFRRTGSQLEVLLVFFKLGVSCFGVGGSASARWALRATQFSRLSFAFSPRSEHVPSSLARLDLVRNLA
jgi:hypothetical protein